MAAIWTALGWGLEALQWLSVVWTLISLGIAWLAVRYRHRMIKRGTW